MNLLKIYFRYINKVSRAQILIKPLGHRIQLSALKHVLRGIIKDRKQWDLETEPCLSKNIVFQICVQLGIEITFLNERSNTFL